jgi:hypothetical protein
MKPPRSATMVSGRTSPDAVVAGPPDSGPPEHAAPIAAIATPAKNPERINSPIHMAPADNRQK